MRKLLLAVASTALAWVYLSISTSHADIKGQPFLPESDIRFNNLEDGSISAPPTKDGHHVLQTAYATYSYSTMTNGATGTYDTGVALPKNAVIVRSWLYTEEDPVSSGNGTLAWYCGTATPFDILAPKTANTANYGTTLGTSHAINGIQDGTVANFSTMSAKCDITAKVATAALQAGKITAVVEYWSHQ